jgi:hypothetical protein
VYEDHVAWVHCSIVGVFLSRRLARALDISLADLQQVLLECRAADRRLGEYIVEQGIMAPAAFREVLAAHNREHFSAFLARPLVESFAFESRPDRYDEAFTFTLDELSSLVPPGGGR